MANANAVRSCRSCGSSSLEGILSLGDTPIANELVDPGTPPEDEQTYPLGIMLCTECGLVQLDHELPAEVIFDDDYPYYSSFAPALLVHSAEHAKGLIESRGLGADSLVVEVASNDGYLLTNFLEAGIPVLGIDPAKGPAAAAIERGVPTLVEFFGVASADRMRDEYGAADVIIANNVMAHVPDLNDFVGGFAALLADDGVLTVENPWVRDTVEHVEFDQIYHEHYCYYSCTAVEALMRRHGLHLNHVEYFPRLHGGTLRWHVSKSPGYSPEAEAFLAEEREKGIASPEYFRRFRESVDAVREGLRSLLTELKHAGHTVAAYGAAAKGATLLNTSGIGTDLVAYVVDRNVHKQGRLMPGCRLPIRPPEALLEEMPDEVLLLAWNFADEIVKQQSEYLDRGGRFLVPVAKDGVPGYHEPARV